jgi:hypothetical protein
MMEVTITPTTTGRHTTAAVLVAILILLLVGRVQVNKEKNGISLNCEGQKSL